MDQRAVIAERIANSLKGISGTGRLFGAVRSVFDKIVLEPGNIAIDDKKVPTLITAPVAYDLWYLYNDVNLITHIDPNTDSELYVSENLKFLEDKLNKLKPLKALSADTLKNYAVETGKLASPPVVPRYGWVAQEGAPNAPLPDPDMDLEQLHSYVASLLAWAKNNGDILRAQPHGFRQIENHWANEGSYFIHVMAFEICQKGTPFAFDSSGLDGKKKASFIGHLTFPVGQLGVMEVISMMQESETDAQDFTLEPDETPVVFDEPPMFPPMEYAGENRSFGKYLIENAYLVPDEVKDQVELMADCKIDAVSYTKDVSPKKWMRLWIKKTDKFPVPGEFIGILVKPLSVPAHVWWFQESTPLLYAGNWVETQNLTSGIITNVKLEADREDECIGDEYKIRINGIECTAYASDFQRYNVGDRVCVLKRWTVTEKATASFTWKDQRDEFHPTKDKALFEFMILPITFYKEE